MTNMETRQYLITYSSNNKKVINGRSVFGYQYCDGNSKENAINLFLERNPHLKKEFIKTIKLK